ncbi:hypothetical protein [Flaviaesturariibacter amylovorans]|uniref:Uncharacterized protein n=1 Tax=Flaviaesturariibacter amylovorans TaxID=1084520 RepID=A0ABP8H1V7_9BACT
MSATQSNLSDARYGYDFVVATTQKSINATLKEYLYTTKFPVVRMYWNQDADGNPVPVSYEDLMKQTSNTDPLKVPSWNAAQPMTEDLTNINNSNFYFAFEAAIGIPSGMAPEDINFDVVTLQPDSNSVVFRLSCATFTIVSCNFGRHGLSSFTNLQQPSDGAWLFTSTVKLRDILNNSNLPDNVRRQLENFGPDAFSVQQLFLDLDTAAIESTPTISGLDTGTPAYNLLSQVFIGAYFNAMKTQGHPVLNYAIVRNAPDHNTSTLQLTNMAMEVSPFIGTPTPALNTLAYLCEVDGNTLPPSVPFSWNWVEPGESGQFDGAIAINRNTFARYFRDQLRGYVSSNCYATWVRVWLSGFLDTTINYSWQLTGNQAPTITMPATGSTVLQFSYASSYSDEAGLGGDMGGMRISTNMDVSVDFRGNQIVISQHFVIECYVRVMQSSETWKAANLYITDTYDLAIDQNGGLTAVLNTQRTDNSDATPSTNWFIDAFTGLNALVSNVDQWTKGFASTGFHTLPVAVAQQFVFPGGKTFAFKDVVFSGNQDLIAHITYVKSNLSLPNPITVKNNAYAAV